MRKGCEKGVIWHTYLNRARQALHGIQFAKDIYTETCDEEDIEVSLASPSFRQTLSAC